MSHTCYVPQVGPLCTEKNSQKLRSRFPVVTRIDFMKNTCNSMKKEEVKITYRKQRKQNKAKDQEIKGNLVLLGRVAASLSKWFRCFIFKDRSLYCRSGYFDLEAGTIGLSRKRW